MNLQNKIDQSARDNSILEVQGNISTLVDEVRVLYKESIGVYPYIHNNKTGYAITSLVDNLNYLFLFVYA